MREIKFSAWDLQTVRMMHASSIEFDGAGEICGILFHGATVSKSIASKQSSWMTGRCSQTLKVDESDSKAKDCWTQLLLEAGHRQGA